ncbi:MAG: hypothetical protein JRJ37_04550 [Deltaproteobacteria bacterium]|nr:hypothetical protein [Deltaproteobacteria bacterium]
MVYLLSITLCLLLPLAGAFLAGNPLEQYLEFPPLTRYVGHAGFSMPVFLAGLAALFILVAFGCRLFSRGEKNPFPKLTQSFPWWGWTGVVLTAVSWFLAWTRFDWFASLQPYTFTPLWIGYILVVSALTFRRSGSCLARRQPRRFILLFPVSTLFWWYFEYLNRFVQNWYYIGIEDFTPTGYVLHASICFATVLPAVICTLELLTTMECLAGRLKTGRSIPVSESPGTGWMLLLVSAVALTSLAMVPDYLFPFVWIAPLFVITGVQVISGRRSFLASLREGKLQLILFSALAALVCGFFWEMWNLKSLAHWQYSIPYVDRFHIFAMPILGYAGYLPFGLECVVVANLVLDRQDLLLESFPASGFEQA